MSEGERTRNYIDRLADEVEREIQRVGASNICAFVAETFPGTVSLLGPWPHLEAENTIQSMGCPETPRDYWPAIRSICDKHDILLILDEILCGMGRTGTQHTWQQENVVPDIQAVGKGLAGGYAPIAMLMMNQKIIDGLLAGRGFFNHGQTFGSHAVSCAAALEVQAIIKRDSLIENARSMGQRLGDGLKLALGGHPHVGDIRGRGLLWAIEFVQEKATKAPFPTSAGIARKVRQVGMREPHNIALYPGGGTADGVVGDHVMIAPAYNVTSFEVDLIIRLVTDVIQETFKQYET